MAFKRIVVPAAIKLSVGAAWIVRRASMSNGIGGLHGASSVRLAIKKVFEHAPVPRTGNEVSMDSLEKSLDWLFSEEPQEGIKCLDVSGEPGRTRTCNPLISPGVSQSFVFSFFLCLMCRYSTVFGGFCSQVVLRLWFCTRRSAIESALASGEGFPSFGRGFDSHRPLHKPC
jgi:hypothetical protein